MAKRNKSIAEIIEIDPDLQDVQDAIDEVRSNIKRNKNIYSRKWL